MASEAPDVAKLHWIDAECAQVAALRPTAAVRGRRGCDCAGDDIDKAHNGSELPAGHGISFHATARLNSDSSTPQSDMFLHASHVRGADVPAISRNRVP